MENSHFELIDSIINRFEIDNTISALEIQEFILTIIENKSEESQNFLISCSMESSETISPAKKKILSDIYENQIVPFLRGSYSSSNFDNSRNRIFFLLIYVIHNLGFKLTDEDIIKLLKEKIRDNNSESPECFLA